MRLAIEIVVPTLLVFCIGDACDFGMVLMALVSWMSLIPAIFIFMLHLNATTAEPSTKLKIGWAKAPFAPCPPTSRKLKRK